jgi:hypothetical protein
MWAFKKCQKICTQKWPVAFATGHFCFILFNAFKYPSKYITAGYRSAALHHVAQKSNQGIHPPSGCY